MGNFASTESNNKKINIKDYYVKRDVLPPTEDQIEDYNRLYNEAKAIIPIEKLEEHFNEEPPNDEYIIDFRIEHLEEAINYQKLWPKIRFKMLTVDLIRERYWNKKTNKCKTIECYMREGDPDDIFGPTGEIQNKKSDLFTVKFKPNGDLLEEWYKDGKDVKKLHKNWLSTNKPGPYKSTEEQRIFYSLEGKLMYYDEYEDLGLQVCSDPLNSLANNCLSGPVYVFDGWINEYGDFHSK